MDFLANVNWVAVLQIIWIDLLLAGDNAVVIALACRQLTGRDRTLGVILGAGAAILLRVLFTLVAAKLMGFPWIMAVGALLLLWIAIKLLVPEEADEHGIAAHGTVWKAVQTIAIADLVMSLDNVIAVAAAAKGDPGLIIFGLIVSIPFVVFGSAMLMKIIDRFPILIWAGAALLGWIAGEIFVKDNGIIGLIGHLPHIPAAIAGALFVVGLGYILRRRKGIGFDGGSVD
jgi:YjbE family integral membrane protein